MLVFSRPNTEDAYASRLLQLNDYQYDVLTVVLTLTNAYHTRPEVHMTALTPMR